MGLPAVGGGASWSAETEMPAVGGVLVSAGRGAGRGLTGLQIWPDAPPRRVTIGGHDRRPDDEPGAERPGVGMSGASLWELFRPPHEII